MPTGRAFESDAVPVDLDGEQSRRLFLFIDRLPLSTLRGAPRSP
ncbi:hypothetical protein N599_16290, partial [Saccharopolyspora erythraea D]